MQRILSSCTNSCVPQLNLLMTYIFMIHKSMAHAQLPFLYIHIAILNTYTFLSHSSSIEMASQHHSCSEWGGNILYTSQHTLDFPVFYIILGTNPVTSHQLLRAGRVQKISLGGVWWAAPGITCYSPQHNSTATKVCPHGRILGIYNRKTSISVKNESRSTNKNRKLTQLYCESLLYCLKNLWWQN